MDDKIKRKWIKALLSGKYEQGEGMLRSKADEYCCLGVLCDLYSKATGVKWKNDGDGYMIHKHDGSLPSKVIKWAGLPKKDPDVSLPDGYKYGDLAVTNDSGKSFKQIAKIIEKNL